MVEGIITIAQKLNMDTVAEGVETQEVQRALTKLGCNIFQGYYHSRPLKLEDLRTFVLASDR